MSNQINVKETAIHLQWQLAHSYAQERGLEGRLHNEAVACCECLPNHTFGTCLKWLRVNNYESIVGTKMHTELYDDD